MHAARSTQHAARSTQHAARSTYIACLCLAMDLAGLAGCTSNEQPPADGAEALSPAPPAGTLNAADTLSSPYQIWGVPKTDFYDTPYAIWPRIRGSTAARYPSTVSTYVTSTPGDVSAGNSGTGLIQYVDAWGGWYVTGTVRDYQSNSCCARARRLESSYLAYIQSSSTEY